MGPPTAPLPPGGSIVVGVDGSVHGERALRWAAEQAEIESRILVAVSVGSGADCPADGAVAAVQQVRPHLPVHSYAAPGDPREVLFDLSAEAHLLVVGSRGLGTWRSLALGSVSSTLAAHARCPVVVCRPPRDPAGDARVGVLVGADGTVESRPVIEFAHRQAALRALPLTVVHCYWDAAAAVARYREARGLHADAPDLEDLRAGLAESVAGLCEDHPEVAVTLTLEHGFAETALSPRRPGWDMVVVGRHPITSVGRIIMGSIATSVVERSHTTVAVVPEAAPRREQRAGTNAATTPST